MRRIIGPIALSMLLSAPTYAGNWRLGPGPSFASGLDDVGDLYENNFNSTNGYYQVDVKYLIPIGLTFLGTYHWESGVRLDLGAGPFFFLSTDSDSDVNLDYFDIPVSATVGYSFIPGGAVSPYVRAGFAHHFASGDYVVGSSPGLYAAAGIDFARNSFVSYALEVAVDRSEVEFDRYTRNNLGLFYDTVNLNTYDVTVGFYIKF